MKYYPVIIIGGGMVAGYLVKEIVSRSSYTTGSLAIISQDVDLPYERPPLSKGLLAGKKPIEKVFINKSDFYEQNGIDVTLKTRVRNIDPAARILTTESGEEYGFDKCILATGGKVRKLGEPADSLGGVHYLRSLQDCLAIRASMERAKRAVVVGAGFIAMEVASVLTEKQIEVTMIFPGDRVWKQFFAPEMSTFFEDYYKRKGVRLVSGAKVADIKGNGHIERVVLSTGQEIETDMAVLGIGIDPVIDIAKEAGILVDNGIVVNEFLETNMPGIYAAGDVANYRDTLFGKQRRTEHWDNAVSQGKYLAAMLSGEQKPFVHVPYFFSDEFDLSYEFWGETENADQIAYRGPVEEGKFSAWWLRDGSVIGAFVMNRPDEEREIAPKWVEEGKRVDRNQLSNEKAALVDL